MSLTLNEHKENLYLIIFIYMHRYNNAKIFWKCEPETTVKISHWCGKSNANRILNWFSEMVTELIHRIESNLPALTPILLQFKWICHAMDLIKMTLSLWNLMAK